MTIVTKYKDSLERYVTRQTLNQSKVFRIKIILELKLWVKGVASYNMAAFDSWFLQ